MKCWEGMRAKNQNIRAPSKVHDFIRRNARLPKRSLCSLDPQLLPIGRKQWCLCSKTNIRMIVQRLAPVRGMERLQVWERKGSEADLVVLIRPQPPQKRNRMRVTRLRGCASESTSTAATLPWKGFTSQARRHGHTRPLRYVIRRASDI